MPGNDDHLDRIIAEWGRERPDLDTRALALVGRLLRVAHMADRALGKGVAKYDLQNGWFDLLAALRRAGTPYELNPTRLMSATMLSSGGTTKRLDHLAEAGLIERRPDPTDRRGVLVRLTRKGKAIIDRAINDHVANEEHLLRSLTQRQRNTLDELLRKLLADLETTRSPMSGDHQ